MSALSDLLSTITGGSTDDDAASSWRTTPIAWRDADGGYVGHNGEVWLYRVFPQVPLEWEDPQTRLAVSAPLDGALQEVAGTSRDLGSGLAMLAKQREFHLISLAWDEIAEPPKGTPERLRAYIDQSLDFTVPTRALFLGVKLWSSVKSRVDREATGVRSLVDSLASSVTRALGEDVPDMADYEDDRKRVEAILSRHHAKTPTRAQQRQLESWFNEGKGIDVEMYRTRDALIVDRQERLEFAGVLGFEDEVMQSPVSQWALDAFTHPQGTSAISIRGRLQPNKVARSRVRRSLRKLRSQQEEEAATSDIDRPEFAQQAAQAQEVEDWVLNSSQPMVVDCSILFGRRVTTTDAVETFVDDLGDRYGINIKPLEWRQLDALDEMLPCSSKRLGLPFSQDLSISMLSYAGLQGFTNLGDPTGVYLGLGDPDWTPVYLNPLGAPRANRPAAMGVLGDSGAGKLLRLTEMLPNATGAVAMGDVSVGDEVLGRDGRPCRVVYLSDVRDDLEMYDVHLSDGQVIRACKDHQWVVASYTDRAAPGKPSRARAIANWERGHDVADQLDQLEGDSEWLPTAQLEELLGPLTDDRHLIPRGKHLGDVLRDLGCTSETREVTMAWGGNEGGAATITTDVYDVAELVDAARARWSRQTHGRWKAQSAERVAVCDRVLRAVPDGARDSITNVAARLLDAGLPSASGRKLVAAQLTAIARDAGLSTTVGPATVAHSGRDAYEVTTDRVCWHVPSATKLLAERLRRRYELKPSTEVLERVLTTADMLEEGVVWCDEYTNFAIRVAEPLDLPDADLPVDPYVFGAWLGDGTTGAAVFTSGVADSCTDDETGVTDQAHLIAQIESAGYAAHQIPSCEKTVGTHGLTGDLSRTGAKGRKHIPVSYLRASAEQRLAVLQGLMDTDGTIDENGSCELSLCDETLAHDALELIRTLGIKVAMTSGDAVITEDDPDNPGAKRRRVTGTRWRMHFTTTTPVFRMPRKARRLPDEVRATQDWLYVTDITPAPSEPGRCIQVDSPDHTYLVAGMVPTHNTYLLQSLTAQAALAGQNVVFINPKPFDDLSPTVEMLRDKGVPGNVVHLSRLEAMGGFFDPFRFVAVNDKLPRQEGLRLAQEQAAEIAAQHITSVIDDLPREKEIDLAYGLKLGATRGARCVAEALEYVEDPKIRELVLKMARSYSLFGLGIGLEPQDRLDAQAGFTLIQFDRKLDLPEDSTGSQAGYTTSQKVAVAALRLITSASLEMLIGGGGGTLVVDEAHHYLGSPQGRKQLQSLGREGRSQGLLPILATQRISDLVGHDLESYVSRWLCGQLTERREAEAALRLCGLEPTEARLKWLSSCGPSGGPSMFVHKDLKNRHAAVMIGPTPPDVHAAFSTNPADRAAREQREADSAPDEPAVPAPAEDEVDLVALLDGPHPSPDADPGPATSGNGDAPAASDWASSFPTPGPSDAGEQPGTPDDSEVTGLDSWLTTADDDPDVDDLVGDWQTAQDDGWTSA